jgi:hypothetical protein
VKINLLSRFVDQLPVVTSQDFDYAPRELHLRDITFSYHLPAPFHDARIYRAANSDLELLNVLSRDYVKSCRDQPGKNKPEKFGSTEIRSGPAGLCRRFRPCSLSRSCLRLRSCKLTTRYLWLCLVIGGSNSRVTRTEALSSERTRLVDARLSIHGGRLGAEHRRRVTLGHSEGEFSFSE